jgi:hypothetical protein
LSGPTDANCSSYGFDNEKEEARPMTSIVGVSALLIGPMIDIKIVIVIKRNP